MAIKESDIRGLFKVITSETMKTVSAGQKTIISPTTIRSIAAEVTKQADKFIYHITHLYNRTT